MENKSVNKEVIALKKLVSSDEPIVVEFRNNLTDNEFYLRIILPRSHSPGFYLIVTSLCSQLIKDSKILALGNQDFYFEGSGAVTITKETIVLSATILFAEKKGEKYMSENDSASVIQVYTRIY